MRNLPKRKSKVFWVSSKFPFFFKLFVRSFKKIFIEKFFFLVHSSWALRGKEVGKGIPRQELLLTQPILGNTTRRIWVDGMLVVRCRQTEKLYCSILGGAARQGRRNRGCTGCNVHLQFFGRRSQNILCNFPFIWSVHPQFSAPCAIPARRHAGWCWLLVLGVLLLDYLRTIGWIYITYTKCGKLQVFVSHMVWIYKKKLWILDYFELASTLDYLIAEFFRVPLLKLLKTIL